MRYTVPRVMPGKIISIWAIIYIIAGIVIFCSENNAAGLIFSLAIGIAPALIRYLVYYKPKANAADKAFQRCCDISSEIDKIRNGAAAQIEST